MPQSVIAHQLANAFLAPDYEAASLRVVSRGRGLAGWDLLDPLFDAFERAATG